MTNEHSKLYNTLKEEYLKAEGIVGDQEKSPKEKVSKLIQLTGSLFNNIENLSLDDLRKLMNYNTLITRLYRLSLEHNWADDF